MDEPRDTAPPIPKMFTALDEHGRAVGFYPDDIYPSQADGSLHAAIPEGAFEISLEDWQAYLVNQPFSAFRSGKLVVLDEPVMSARVETPPPEPNPFDAINAALADIAERLSALEKK
jgi:hypothetical protein